MMLCRGLHGKFGSHRRSFREIMLNNNNSTSNKNERKQIRREFGSKSKERRVVKRQKVLTTDEVTAETLRQCTMVELKTVGVVKNHKNRFVIPKKVSAKSLELLQTNRKRLVILSTREKGLLCQKWNLCYQATKLFLQERNKPEKEDTYAFDEDDFLDGPPLVEMSDDELRAIAGEIAFV